MACLSLVISAAYLDVFFEVGMAIGAASLALLVYFLLCWNALSRVTRFLLSLAIATFSAAFWFDVNGPTILDGLSRMIFLSALLSVLGLLRSAAAKAREVADAGAFLTSQPPGRRYLALTVGGHIFGTLINLGGLAILLDMTTRALARERGNMSVYVSEWRLRRMTLAIIRGFSLISLWSPLGFAINIVLLNIPDLQLVEIAPIGLAATFLLIGMGWTFDYFGSPRRSRGLGTSGTQGGLGPVFLLFLHVLVLGGAVIAVEELSALSFQKALLLVVPLYCLFWSFLQARSVYGTVSTMAATVSTTVRRFPASASEVGVFASAGLLAVIVLALIPMPWLQDKIIGLSLDPALIVVTMSLTVYALCCIGINPIITASILGSLAYALDLPGLSSLAAALALLGGWGSAIPFSPFITTVVYTGALIGRSPVEVGMRWNGPYSLTMLILWSSILSLAVYLGWV